MLVGKPQGKALEGHKWQDIIAIYLIEILCGLDLTD
jgi:hypothetical protein